jgi:hypothetical protein
MTERRGERIRTALKRTETLPQGGPCVRLGYGKQPECRERTLDSRTLRSTTSKEPDFLTFVAKETGRAHYCSVPTIA